MLAKAHLPRTFDAFVHLVAATVLELNPHAGSHEPTAGTIDDAEPEGRPGHALSDRVGVALYNATLAGARPWGC